MPLKPVVSIVGRPNVGKSSLFNRIIGKRIAVVDDFAGVTRDRNYYAAQWSGVPFLIVDTGGLIPNLHTAIPEAIHDQVNIAIKESDAVLFLVDAGTGPTDLDLLVAKQLRRISDKVILVANKAESTTATYDLDSYRALGIGAPVPVSALHGNGVGDLLDSVLEIISKKSIEPEAEEAQPDLKLTIIGRPNAGKSSLVNKLLGRNRMIVDNKPGTTRDAIDSELDYNGRKIVLIDTAGLRKRARVKQDMEYYSNLRALSSIERCDVCVLMIDVMEEIGVQDLRIIKKIIEMHKGILLCWNKWDLKEKDHRTFDQLVAEKRREFMELKWIPMLSISALTGQRVTAVIENALKIKERMQIRVPSSEFENQVFGWVRAHPHPAIPENPVRFLGARQIGVPYPLFRFFVTNPDEVTPGYIRFLTNKIYENYDFDGCPLTLEFRPIKKQKRVGVYHFGNEHSGDGDSGEVL
ncbi:MAG TPA: ribosome biogenesis GTPase Der [Chitinispirillaceae bacterium]|nr:ribosome biogenesis GTPase Der [Chitinispirillaceae bacterium]